MNGLCPECGTVTTDPMVLYRAYLPGAKSERLWTWLRRPIAIGLAPFILAVVAAIVFIAIDTTLEWGIGKGGNQGTGGSIGATGRTQATNPNTGTRDRIEQLYAFANMGWMLGSPGLMLLLWVFTLTRSHPTYALPHFRIIASRSSPIPRPAYPNRSGVAIVLFAFITVLTGTFSWFCGLAIFLLVTAHFFGIN